MLDVDALYLDAADAAQAAQARLASAPGDIDALVELGAQLRQVGAGALLAQGDVAGFHDALRRSGDARLTLLQHPVPAVGSASRRHFAKGNGAGLVDAIVGEDAPLARAIADAAPQAPLARVELEEDFFEVSLIERLVRHDPRSMPPAARAAAEADVAALAALGPLSPRAQTFAALVLEAGVGFDAAWDAWVDARSTAQAAASRQLRRAPRLDFVDTVVFLDGLAALRFAAALGCALPEPDVGLPELILGSLRPWSWT